MNPPNYFQQSHIPFKHTTWGCSHKVWLLLYSLVMKRLDHLTKNVQRLIQPIHHIQVTINSVIYLNIFSHHYKSVENIIYSLYNYTFGWNNFVLNTTLGGLLGYSSLNSRRSLNTPPSHIDYSGPKITASHNSILSSNGAALNP